MAEEETPRERPQKAKKKPAAKKKAAPKKEASPTHLVEILGNWNLMNNKMKDLDEKELATLIQMEQDGKNRIHMLNRIHARFTRVRSERERREIMAGEKLVV